MQIHDKNIFKRLSISLKYFYDYQKEIGPSANFIYLIFFLKYNYNIYTFLNQFKIIIT